MKKNSVLLVIFLVLMGVSCDLRQDKPIGDRLFSKTNVNWIVKGDPEAVLETSKELRLIFLEKITAEDLSYCLVSVPTNLGFSQEELLKKFREKGEVNWIELDQKPFLTDAVQPFTSFPYYYQNIQTWSDISHLAQALSLYGVGSHTAQLAFIDTGFDTDHQEFSDESVFKGFSIVSRTAENQNSLIKTKTTYSIDGGAYEIPDYVVMTKGIEWDSNPGEGHGSHVVGIMAGNQKILGVCPANRFVLGYKIFANDVSGLGVNGAASLFSIFSTLPHIHLNRKDNNVLVVNYSLGFERPSSFALEMINFAYSHKILVMASSGNDGYVASSFPAHYSGVMAIGATDGKGDIAYFSSGSPTLSVVALGQNVYSVKAGVDNEYRYMSGTSMSCPFVVGMAGYLLTFAPTLSLGELRTVIEDTAKRKDSIVWDNRYGYGVVDVKAAVEKAKRHQARLEGQPDSVQEDLIQSRYSDQILEITVDGSKKDKAIGEFVFLKKKGGIIGTESDYRYYTFSGVSEDKKIIFAGLPYGEYRVNLLGSEIDFSLTASGSTPASLSFTLD